jgi:hypothetical protein
MSKESFSSDLIPDTLEMPVMDIFTIAGDMTKMQESYER